MSEEVKPEERCPFFYCSDKAAGIQCIKTAGAHHCDFGPNAHDRYQVALVGRASRWGNDLVKLLTDPAPFTQPAIPTGYNQLNDWFQMGQAFSQPGAAQQYWNRDIDWGYGSAQLYAQYVNPPSTPGSICAASIHRHKDGVTEVCGPECEYRKTEPAKPLPFKRHPKCDLWHDTHPNSGGCLSCEHLIGDEMAMLDEKTKPAAKPVARTPYEPLLGSLLNWMKERRR